MIKADCSYKSLVTLRPHRLRDVFLRLFYHFRGLLRTQIFLDIVINSRLVEFLFILLLTFPEQYEIPRSALKIHAVIYSKFCKCEPSMTLHFIQHNVHIDIKKKSQLRLTNKKVELQYQVLIFLSIQHFRKEKKIKDKTLKRP